MIDWYKKKIEGGLNDTAKAMDLDRTFVIFADAGYVKDAETYAEDTANELDTPPNLVFGTLDAQPSRMAPIPGLSVVSVTGTLTIMPEARLGKDGSEQGQLDELTVIENILNAYTRATNGRTYNDYVDELGVRFTVTVNFSPVTNGDWQLHSIEYGETVPLTVSVYLTAVQEGVSSNDVQIFVDGYPIFYETLLPARQKTLDQFTYEGQSVKSVAVQHAITIDATVPLLRSRICVALLAEMLEGSYTIPHLVTLKYPSYEKTYLCLLGSSNTPSKPGLNVGFALSFAEAKEDVAMEGLGGYKLPSLGSQFRKAADGRNNFGNLTIGYLKKIFGDDALVIGKRYACAASVKYLDGTEYTFVEFVYTGQDDTVLIDKTGATYARLTYGE